jgi:hypothetical protein
MVLALSFIAKADPALLPGPGVAFELPAHVSTNVVFPDGTTFAISTTTAARGCATTSGPNFDPALGAFVTQVQDVSTNFLFQGTPLGTIRIVNNPAFSDSGMIISLDTSANPQPTFPALSFFDKHLLVQVLDNNGQVIAEFFNKNPARVSAFVTEWPPFGSTYTTADD